MARYITLGLIILFMLAGNSEGSEPSAERGRYIFMNRCVICHYPDSARTRVGPGMKGMVSKKSFFPVSKRRVSPKIFQELLQQPAGSLQRGRHGFRIPCPSGADTGDDFHAVATAEFHVRADVMAASPVAIVQRFHLQHVVEIAAPVVHTVKRHRWVAGLTIELVYGFSGDWHQAQGPQTGGRVLESKQADLLIRQIGGHDENVLARWDFRVYDFPDHALITYLQQTVLVRSGKNRVMALKARMENDRRFAAALVD